MQEYCVQCRRKESSRSLSHLLVSFLYDDVVVAEEMEMDPSKNCKQQQQLARCTAVSRKAAAIPPLEVSVYTHYEDQHSLVVGVILIIAGVLCIIITGIGVGVYSLFSFIAHGIWIGIVVSKRM